MRNDTINGFLQALGDRVPAPGGGASAGLHAAQAAERSAAVEAATLGAARPPEALVQLVSRILDLAEDLLPVSNRTVISDVTAAAEAARTAATTARVNIEINLVGISGTAAWAELCAAANSVDRLTERAERLTAAVRAELIR